jgi:hypothetical protein
LTYEIIYQRRYPQKNNKWRIPCRVKNVTGQQQVYLLSLPRKRQVVDYEYEYKKSNEGVGIEDHKV